MTPCMGDQAIARPLP